MRESALQNTVPTRRPATILIPKSPQRSEAESSDGIVETIFRGVTEDIFRAFQRSHPGMFPREFDSFAKNVRQGLGCGVGDAKDELTHAGHFAAQVESAFHRNSGALFERLEGWFDETRARLFD